jgi:hypothetical protein
VSGHLPEFSQVPGARSASPRPHAATRGCDHRGGGYVAAHRTARGRRDAPATFRTGTELVTEQQIASSLPCGPDPEEHITAIQAYVDAGFEEIFVGQIGPDHDGIVDFYAREILPHFAS